MKSSNCSAVLAACVLLSAEADASLVTGLVNYWHFDNVLGDAAHGMAGSSSSVADNGVIAGANGTDGISFGAGLFGGAGIALNGAASDKENDGYVRVARSADTLFGANVTGASTNTVTTSLWVSVDGNDQSWQTMLSHGEGAQYRFARRDASATNAAYAGGAGDIPGSNLGPDLTGGGWHHVIGISEGGVSVRLWVDGQLVATGGVPVINDAQGGGLLDLHIGANPDTGAQNREWWGQIDDVAQWNRVLDESEIAALWGGGPGTAQSLGVLIPEPSTLLLGWAGLAMILRRRRR